MRVIHDLASLFNRGVIIPSADFNVDRLPDGRSRITLAQKPARAYQYKPPRPFLIQTVALIHFDPSETIKQIFVSDDLAAIQSGSNGGFVGSAPASWDLRATNPLHPNSNKTLLANWFGGLGFAVYIDSIKAWFPQLASFTVEFGTDVAAPIAIEIVKGGNTQHLAGDVSNPTGNVLQTLTAPDGGPILHWDFATNTASLV